MDPAPLFTIVRILQLLTDQMDTLNENINLIWHFITTNHQNEEVPEQTNQISSTNNRTDLTCDETMPNSPDLSDDTIFDNLTMGPDNWINNQPPRRQNENSSTTRPANREREQPSPPTNTNSLSESTATTINPLSRTRPQRPFLEPNSPTTNSTSPDQPFQQALSQPYIGIFEPNGPDVIHRRLPPQLILRPTSPVSAVPTTGSINLPRENDHFHHSQLPDDYFSPGTSSINPNNRNDNNTTQHSINQSTSTNTGTIRRSPRPDTAPPTRFNWRYMSDSANDRWNQGPNHRSTTTNQRSTTTNRQRNLHILPTPRNEQQIALDWICSHHRQHRNRATVCQRPCAHPVRNPDGTMRPFEHAQLPPLPDGFFNRFPHLRARATSTHDLAISNETPPTSGSPPPPYEEVASNDYQLSTTPPPPYTE